MNSKVKLKLLLVLTSLIIIACGGESTQPAESSKGTVVNTPQPDDTKVLIGQLKSIGDDGKHLVITTAKGVEERIEVESDTTFQKISDSAKSVGHEAAKAGKMILDETEEGFHTVVHYTEKAGKKTASFVKHEAHEAANQGEVVVQKVDHAAGTVVVKTQNGAEEVYHFAEDTTVKAGDKLVNFGDWIADKTEDAGEAVIHFTEKNGKKVVHAIEHAGEN